MSSTESTKRIAKNTLMLYTRQILILFVGLYTVRVVLDALGVEDYGIYSVVGGIVSFFSFLSATMASATQRFFSFALGENDEQKLQHTFIVSCIIYLSIAICAMVLLETIGIWFVSNHLNVPIERIDSTIILFHFSVFTFVATILATPFMSIIISHEDMHIYAYMSIVDVVLKLLIVLLLANIDWDKLELYGILLFFVSIITTSLYTVICFRKYEECQFRKLHWDYSLFKEIVGFTGWTLFGQLSTVARRQAVTILLNQGFNPVVVASRAIAINITSKIVVFSNNFNTGLYPPIIKAYAAGEEKQMLSLVFNGSKITFFLMWVFALPMFIEMDVILNTWLKETPEMAILFTRLAVIEVVINSLSLPIATAARAPGKMKQYELVLGLMQMTIFFVSWCAIELGAAAYIVFVIAIAINLAMLIVRLFLVKKLIHLSIPYFFKTVISPISAIVFISLTLSLLVDLFLPTKIWYSILVVMMSITFSSVSMYYIGLDKSWRARLKSIVTSKFLNLVYRR